ncbi:MAG: bifunctional DNA primase/polymerase [Myxococcales bacterium]|nr:MAG: bifunctional DNA primase/polymerase [Myxococcales bacterium]
MIFLRAASAYAELGFHVLPIAGRGKAPLCRRGERDATRDPAILHDWARRWPTANIGIAPSKSGHFVLDIDVRNFGDESLAALPVLPSTVTALTGGGGFHLWFRRNTELDDVRRTTLPVDGVDVSGIDVKGLLSGYVVVPPSQHPNGRRYRWEASSRLGEAELALPPVWLVRRLSNNARRARRPRALGASVEAETFYLGLVFKLAGWLGDEVRPGVFAVRCPTEQFHSTGRPFDSSTVIFAPSPGSRDRRGVFYCAHSSHCSEAWR